MKQSFAPRHAKPLYLENTIIPKLKLLMRDVPELMIQDVKYPESQPLEYISSIKLAPNECIAGNIVVEVKNLEMLEINDYNHQKVLQNGVVSENKIVTTESTFQTENCIDTGNGVVTNGSNFRTVQDSITGNDVPFENGVVKTENVFIVSNDMKTNNDIQSRIDVKSENYVKGVIDSQFKNRIQTIPVNTKNYDMMMNGLQFLNFDKIKNDSQTRNDIEIDKSIKTKNDMPTSNDIQMENSIKSRNSLKTINEEKPEIKVSTFKENGENDNDNVFFWDNCFDSESSNKSPKSQQFGNSQWSGPNLELSPDIAQQVLVEYSGLRDIAGLEEVKQRLRECVIYPKRYPQLFTNGRSVWSRALLFGVPGVGKTMLAHAVAAEAKLPLYQVSCADLLSPWIGQTEKLVRRLFSVLAAQHCILFLDEVDALCRKRGSTDSAHCRRAATELLIQMQQHEGSAMFILCATNCPWEIDPAFLRRLQQRIYVPLPEYEARHKIVVSNLGESTNLHSEKDWERFIEATDGLSGSDLKNLVRSALMLPLREMQACKYWLETPNKKIIPSNDKAKNAICCALEDIPDHMVCCRPVQMSDLWMALKKADRTVTQESLEPFTKFLSDHKI